jgi:hypothetical protein
MLEEVFKGNLNLPQSFHKLQGDIEISWWSLETEMQRLDKSCCMYWWV